MRSLLLAVTLICLVLARPVASQEPITSGTPDVIRGLLENAAKDRTQAQHELDLVKRYRELAAQARAVAEREKDIVTRYNDLKRAENYEADAHRSELNADTLQRSANSQDQRAADLQRAYDSSQNAGPAAKPPSVGAIAGPEDVGSLRGDAQRERMLA